MEAEGVEFGGGPQAVPHPRRLHGAMGDTLLDVNGVKALAELPSLDELRARIVGLIQAPATKIAQLANAPAAKLARVFGAYAAKEEA